MAYIINGEHIGDQVIEDEFESIKDHYESIGETICCDRDEEILNLSRENVINRTLLEQRSISKYGEAEEAAVEKRFKEVIAEHGGEQNFYDNTGFNPGDASVIKRKLKSRLMIDRLLEDELGEETSPTDEDLTKFYEENIENYMSEEQVRVSQIFVEPTSQDAAKEAFIALRAVRQELLQGKDFHEAALEHSSDGDRDIDLGFMKQGETMPEVEAITFSMNIGEISPIVATHYGFHLFKVTGKKKSEPVPMEEIDGLSERYLAERKAKAIDDYIKQLKENGSVEEVAESAPDQT